MKVFNGLAREHLARQRARMLSPVGRPTHLQPHADGSFAKLITCPKCSGKGLPLHNSQDVAWTAQCLKCAAIFAFHDSGVNPGDAIRQAKGLRDRAAGIRERTYGGRRYLDADKFLEEDWEARTMGRRANSLGIRSSRTTS